MNNTTQIYTTLQAKHEQEVTQLKNTSLQVSILRMVAAIGFGFSLYYYFQVNNDLLLVVTGICAAGFFTLIKAHRKISFKREIKDALVTIN
ncbi:MAG: hypothetical protein QMB65_07810, partial [Vicingaceae bacterium]